MERDRGSPSAITTRIATSMAGSYKLAHRDAEGLANFAA